MSCTEWKEYKLDEVYEVSNGLSKKREEFGFGYEFLAFTDVFNNYFVPQTLDNLVNSSEMERVKCSIKRGDVFLTRTSEKLDELGRSCVALKDYPNATFNGFTKRLRPIGNVEILPEYAGYYFRSLKFRNAVTSMSSMTTRASLNNDMISLLTITVPTLEEQENIANILSCLDEKIELNNEMNKTLEEMAQCIFKRWFVDFEFPNEDGEPYKSSGGEMVDSELGMIPKGWEVKTLDYVGDIVSGGTPSTKNEEYYGGDISWITPKDLSGYNRKFISKGERCITELGLQKSSAKLLPKGTVLFSSRAPIGYVAIAEKEVSTNQGFKSVVCNEEIMNNNYVYYFLKYNKENIENVSSGSTFKEISGSHMKNIKIIVPSKIIIDKFNDLVSSFDSLLKKNYEDIDTLEEIRDSLLPKLMSGEIQI